MERRIKGLGLVLFSLLLAVCFQAMQWRWFDLLMFETPWPVVFLLVGAVGLALTFWPQPPE